MKSSLYLKHDIYALNDTLIIRLVYKYQAMGYGLFWAVIESLTIEESHKMPIDLLSMELEIKLKLQDNAKVIEIIEYMVEIGLLAMNECHEVWSERVLRQCEEVEKVSQVKRENVKARWEAVRAKKAENEDSDAVVAKKVLDLYSTICKSLPKVRTMTPQRKVHSRTLVQEYGLETIEEGFKKAEASKFLKEGNGTWNGANFDWLINKQNFAKVLEGNYADRTRTSVCNESSSYASDINSNGGFDL